MLVRTQKMSFEGQVGQIDCIVDLPGDTPRGWALVLHPHPLHGGSQDNKVVTTIARACVQHGLVAVRPNFRGVGASAGAFDAAVGETADMLLLSAQFADAFPDAANGKWVVAGFSFGTAVAAQLYSARAEQNLTLPDALLLFGSAVERFRFRAVNLPEHTTLVHGEVDEVVPLSEAMELARAHALPIVVVPDASHFFHGKLITLKNVLQQRLLAV